jgi:hypothetical protein
MWIRVMPVRRRSIAVFYCDRGRSG